MKWLSEKVPACGEMIRVKTGNIYHYGVFIREDEIVQFGLAPMLRPTVKNEDITVLATDLATFSCGGVPEVADFDEDEKKNHPSSADAAARAKERIGERGYHLLRNNCEHFAYECVTGKKYCSQTDSVRALFRQLPVLDLYVAPLPQEPCAKPLACEAREREIAAIKHERVKREKYYVFKLLAYALERSLGLHMEKMSFEKKPNGNWVTPSCFFSLSHSGDALAVAVSREEVGADIEPLICERMVTIAQMILTEREASAFAACRAEEKPLFLTRKWTEKESVFKKRADAAFSPRSIETEEEQVQSGTCTLNGRTYSYSVAARLAERVRLITDIDPSIFLA